MAQRHSLSTRNGTRSGDRPGLPLPIGRTLKSVAFTRDQGAARVGVRRIHQLLLWLEQANLAGALRRKAQSGCRVRFLIGDPASPVTAAREAEEGVPLTLSTRIAVTLAELGKLRDVSSIEARFETGHVNLSVFRFDDEMIVTPILARRVGHDSPMMHLRRAQTDGMFDRFSAHVEELWTRGRDIAEAGHDGQA